MHSLGWEDPLEEGMATHSGVLHWRIPWAEEPGGLQPMGSQRVGHHWRDLACPHCFILGHLPRVKERGHSWPLNKVGGGGTDSNADENLPLKRFSSVRFSRSVVSNSLRPHELQHARPPCPSPTPRIDSNSHPSSWWCHPTISSSVVPFSSCPQSLPASESFPMSQLFTWGGQSTGVSALASFLPKNTQLPQNLTTNK